jgi:hypothetical protein
MKGNDQGVGPLDHKCNGNRIKNGSTFHSVLVRFLFSTFRRLEASVETFKVEPFFIQLPNTCIAVHGKNDQGVRPPDYSLRTQQLYQMPMFHHP